MNKFDRVISTLVLLQSRKVITATTISERYDISLRTVYRDIKTLKTAGIPIIGDPGIGYSIMEGYRLPPIMFSEGEAAALLTAEKFIGKMTDQSTQTYYSNALTKIKAILRSSEKQALEVLDDSIAFSNKSTSESKSYLQDLFKSIAAKNVLYIEYQKVNGTKSKRKVEPIGCYHHLNNWYLVAFCLLQNDYRIFKMKRVLNLEVLDEYFDTEHISLKECIDRQNEAWKEKYQFYTIEIAFDRSMVEFAESRKHYFGFIEESNENETVRMKFLNSEIEVLARWLLQFGNHATVLTPVELKDRMRVLSDQLHNHYK